MSAMSWEVTDTWEGTAVVLLNRHNIYVKFSSKSPWSYIILLSAVVKKVSLALF